MNAHEKFGEDSRSHSRSRLRLEQLLRFSRALLTSGMHPQLDIHTLNMNQLLNNNFLHVCLLQLYVPSHQDFQFVHLLQALPGKQYGHNIIINSQLLLNHFKLTLYSLRVPIGTQYHNLVNIWLISMNFGHQNVLEKIFSFKA